jgi:hypothetical protein
MVQSFGMLLQYAPSDFELCIALNIPSLTASSVINSGISSGKSAGSHWQGIDRSYSPSKYLLIAYV